MDYLVLQALRNILAKYKEGQKQYFFVLEYYKTIWKQV